MSKKVFAFGLMVVILLIVGLYRAKDGARESSAEIIQLEAQISEAYRQKALLEADLAHMSRREWIEEYARNELGMGPAKASQYATDYNLDLLVGRAVEAEPESQKASSDKAQAPQNEASVAAPLSEASTPETGERAQP